MQKYAQQFDLDRFVLAQLGVFETALAELRSGRKQSHWIWFVFPQLAGLGRSPNSHFYGIRSIDEARAYLAHPLLGPRLKQSVEALLGWAGRRDAESILGQVDATKLRSCLTLFAAASGDPLYDRALHIFFPDGPDPLTQQLLAD